MISVANDCIQVDFKLTHWRVFLAVIQVHLVHVPQFLGGPICLHSLLLHCIVLVTLILVPLDAVFNYQDWIKQCMPVLGKLYTC